MRPQEAAVGFCERHVPSIATLKFAANVLALLFAKRSAFQWAACADAGMRHRDQVESGRINSAVMGRGVSETQTAPDGFASREWLLVATNFCLRHRHRRRKALQMRPEVWSSWTATNAARKNKKMCPRKP
jgi:hypothetical protein